MESTGAVVRRNLRRRPLSLSTLLAGSLGLAAFALHAVMPDGRSDAGHVLTLGLTAAFFVAEGLTIHIPTRRESHTISLVEIPLVLGLAFAVPNGLLFARLLGSGAALILVRRQFNPLKLGFNISVFSLETAAATAVYLWIAGGAAPTSTIAWVAIGGALFVFQTIGALAVGGVIWINDSRPQLSTFLRIYLIGLVGAAMAGAWGLVAISIIEVSPLAAIPLGLLAGSLYGLLRIFGRLRRRHQDLLIVHSFTIALDAVEDPAELPGLLIEVAASHFMAATSILLSQSQGRPAILALNDSSGGPTAIEPGDSFDFDAAAVEFGDQPGILSPEMASEVETWTGIAIGHGVTLPIPATRALLILGNPRPGHSIGLADLELLRTLGSHAGSVFERHRLFGALTGEMELRKYQAMHDDLTDLPNRAHFVESVDRMLRTPQFDSEVGVILLDIDDFKTINDTLSHQAGDQVLIDMGRRLQEVIRSADVIARVGGDEFAAAIRVGSVADAIAIAQRIKEGLQHPFISAGLRVEIGASIGIALGATTAIAMLRRADIAMYAAKHAEQGIEIYREEIDNFDASRLALAGELRPAIESGQVKVYYQPKVRAHDSAIAGFEALVRWIHPTRGMVSPAEIIPIAERTGLMVPLTEHVLETALMDARGWDDRGWTVSVNFSPGTLANDSLARSVQEALTRTGTEANRLIVEVTESGILSDPRGSTSAIDRLHDLGAVISIDDFGTGYSSMSRLRTLPIGELKIDRSFISTFESDQGSRAIVETTLTLARRLGLRTVAEGVEEASTLAELRHLGVDEIQGYYYSPALPIDELWKWIEQHESRHGLKAIS